MKAKINNQLEYTKEIEKVFNDIFTNTFCKGNIKQICFKQMLKDMKIDYIN